MNSPPNILWIVSDHQIHATRPKDFGEFPLQKVLANSGLEFTRAYSVLPVCSPARASMLTGLYPHAHGLTENDGRFGGREGLDSSDWMIQHALGKAGYRCGWFGKWHVDNHFSATDYGFEGFSLPGYGYPYGSEAYRAYLKRKGLPGPTARIEMSGESGLSRGNEVQLTEVENWFDYESGVARLQSPVETHEAYFLASLAGDWIESNDSEPYFLRLDTWGPHPPYTLAEPFYGMFDDKNIQLPGSFFSDLENRPDHHRGYRNYWHETLGYDDDRWRLFYTRALEHVALVETAICRLLENLDLENTLVIFNSDHGDAVGSNGGIANKGGLMVEATMRTPMLISGAEVSTTGLCDELVSNLDLVPTILDICGIDTKRELHGVSLKPLLQDSDARIRTGLMTQHYGLHERIPQRAFYQDDWKLVVQEDGFLELYNLSHDPDELDNRALHIESRDMLDEMRVHLLSAMSAVSDTDTAINKLLK